MIFVLLKSYFVVLPSCALPHMDTDMLIKVSLESTLHRPCSNSIRFRVGHLSTSFRTISSASLHPTRPQVHQCSENARTVCVAGR
ncbi:hypothetical protein EDD16DRAFT_1252511 [Pisolithus croceorrhizus]|nr:hypothetical protein EDD16DRAFT_1252511 [Pisolithus croceorrhizus]